MIKVGEQLLPDNESEQADFVTEWTSKAQEETFHSFVAVEKKKVLGWISGILSEDKVFSVGLFHGQSPGVLQALWKKTQRNVDPAAAVVPTEDPELFKTLGFQPMWTLMNYQKDVIESGV